MCLELTTNQVQIATVPLKVYKVALIKDGNFFAPFRSDYQYPIGALLVSPLIVEENKRQLNNYKVEIGLHTLFSYDSAKRLKQSVDEEGYPVTILECEIPAGAKYISGKWMVSVHYAYSSMTFHAIASDQLRIIAEMK